MRHAGQRAEEPRAARPGQPHDVDEAAGGEDHHEARQDRDHDVDRPLVLDLAHRVLVHRVPVRSEAEADVEVAEVTGVAALLEVAVLHRRAVLTSKGPLRGKELVLVNAVESATDRVIREFLDPGPTPAVSLALFLITSVFFVTVAFQSLTSNQGE